MNNTENKTEIIQYSTKGTCCKVMNLEIKDEVIQSAEFIGGCPGNLIGIQNLVKGMPISEIIQKFSGIKCGDKSTSCPDQLAQCLMQYRMQKDKLSIK